jgi:uncharacterized protein YndB with AHSA1/START domain
MKLGFLTALALAIATPVAAQELTPGNGFTSVNTITIAAAPDKVWAVLIRPAAWWDPAHSYSNDSANLTIDARAGGCWCETLANGGSVEHMRVLFVQPGKMIRFAGGLGPLQEMPIAGVMTFTLKPLGARTELAITYKVSGQEGLGALAKQVDAVLAGQWARLKAAAEKLGS